MSLPLLPGAPQSWKVTWRSIEYPGQVIIAPRWKPSFGKELAQEDLHFRTVILTQPQEVPLESIRDRRIALWVPEQPLAAPDASTPRKLKEAGIAYEVGDGHPGGTTLGRGQVISASPLPRDIADRLSSASLEEGLNIVATALLEGAYTDFPLDTSVWEHALTSADIANLFEGLLRQRDDPPALAAVERFAVGLGLARPSAPLTFAPHSCPIFPHIIDMLDESGGRLSIRTLYRQLSLRFGLPRPLITLYLLSLLRHNDPPLEIRLRPRHRTVLRSGERPPQGRLTSPLASQVWWGRGLEEDFAELRYSSEFRWDTVLPYARAVIKDLKPAADPVGVSMQESSLLAALKELRTEAEQARSELSKLASALGGTPDAKVSKVLEQLATLAQSDSYASFYTSSQRLYTSPEALDEDVAFCRQLRALTPLGEEMKRAKAYLTKALVGDREQELELDRLSLLEQLTLPNLISNPQLWDSLKSLIHWFRSRYSVLYAAHHRRYWQEVSAWERALADARTDLETLERLNSIEELGRPLGQELSLDYQRLVAQTKLCPLGEAREPLREWEPLCNHCGLLLTAEPPRRELEDFLARLHQALAGQQRRLSSQAVRQILGRSSESRLERFIKVIQTSDLSPLSQVMDDELVGFICRLLAEAHMTVPTKPLLAKLGEKYPKITEPEVETVAAELVRLLQEAFEEAKAKQLGTEHRKGAT